MQVLHESLSLEILFLREYMCGVLSIPMVIASGSAGKIQEIKAFFPNFDVQSMQECGFNLEIKEKGSSFQENALLKAQTLERFLLPRYDEFLVLADDSGICVDALNGEPGIFSARYASLRLGLSRNCSDEENRYCLIDSLKKKNLSSSTARFVCFLMVLGRVRMDGALTNIHLEAEGECKGVIFDYERGENGFGYDSLFQPDGFKVSMAELSFEEKNAISHRSKALKEIKRELDIFSKRLSI